MDTLPPSQPWVGDPMNTGTDLSKKEPNLLWSVLPSQKWSTRRLCISST